MAIYFISIRTKYTRPSLCYHLFMPRIRCPLRFVVTFKCLVHVPFFFVITFECHVHVLFCFVATFECLLYVVLFSFLIWQAVSLPSISSILITTSLKSVRILEINKSINIRCWLQETNRLVTLIKDARGKG